MTLEHAAPRGIHLRDVSSAAEAAEPKVPTLDDLISTPAESEQKLSAFAKLADKVAKRLLPSYLSKIGLRRGAVQAELRAIPQRMQKLTNQASLMLELVDDFRAGRYRALAIRNLAVGAAALLYAVSPTDVVPDVLPGVGALDDALVLGIALRIMKRDLVKYCAHKGYDPKNYF